MEGRRHQPFDHDAFIRGQVQHDSEGFTAAPRYAATEEQLRERRLAHEHRIAAMAQLRSRPSRGQPDTQDQYAEVMRLHQQAQQDALQRLGSEELQLYSLQSAETSTRLQQVGAEVEAFGRWRTNVDRERREWREQREQQERVWAEKREQARQNRRQSTREFIERHHLERVEGVKRLRLQGNALERVRSLVEALLRIEEDYFGRVRDSNKGDFTDAEIDGMRQTVEEVLVAGGYQKGTRWRSRKIRLSFMWQTSRS